MSFFEAFLSGLFPDRCVGCSARGSLLCAACKKKLPPSGNHEESFVASVYAYADPRVRKLVKLLKYKNTRHAAALFGRPLAAAVEEFIGEESLFLGDRPVLVVPVPLGKARRKMRGYNQAELLARAMIAELGPSKGSQARLDPRLLEKHRDTKPQVDISKRSMRLKNLGDCFRVRDGRVSNGEIVILVDDVTTTGATLLACKAALGRAGFRQVHAFTVAH